MQYLLEILQRYIAVLPGRVCITLVGDHLECVYQARTGFTRFDDIIDETPGCSDVRIGKVRPVFGNQFCPAVFHILRFGEFFAEDDVDRPFRTHHGDLCGGPGKIDITTYMFAAHHVIGTTVSFAGHDGQLGNCGFAVGEQQFRPMADDAAVFLPGAG